MIRLIDANKLERAIKGKICYYCTYKDSPDRCYSCHAANILEEISHARKVCAGLVQGAKTEPYLSALCTAEQMIFDKYPAGQQDEAHRLAAAIKVNVKHPRRPSVATLLRQFDLNISEKTFRRYKREYCYTLALEAGLIPDASPKR